MRFEDLKERCDALAWAAMLYVPLLFVFTTLVVMVCAVKPDYIVPGVMLAFAICFVLLILGLLPSWLMDHIAPYIRKDVQ